MDITRKSLHVDGDPPLRMKRPRDPLRQPLKPVSGAFDVPDINLANGRQPASKATFQSVVAEDSARGSEGIPTVVPRRPRTGSTKPRTIAVEKCVFANATQALPHNRLSPVHSESQSPEFDDDSEEQMAEALLDLANAFHCPPPPRPVNRDTQLPGSRDDRQQQSDLEAKVPKSEQRPKKKARHNLTMSHKSSDDSKDTHQLISQTSPSSELHHEGMPTSSWPRAEVDKRQSPVLHKHSEDKKTGWLQELPARKSSSSGARSPGHVAAESKAPGDPPVTIQVKKHKDHKRNSVADRSGVSGSDLSNSSAGTRQETVHDAVKPAASTKNSLKRCALHVYIAHFIAEQQRLQQNSNQGAIDISKRPISPSAVSASPKGQIASLKSSPVSSKHASAKQTQHIHPSFKNADKQEVNSKPQPALSLPFGPAGPLSFLPGLLPHPSLPHMPPVSVPITCSMPLNPGHLPPQFPPLNLMQHAGHPFPLFPGFHPPQGFPSPNPLAAQAAAAAAAAAPFMGAPHFPFAGVLPPHLPAPLAVSAALSAQIRPDLGLLTRSLDVKDVERPAAKFPLMDEIVENLLLRGRRV